MERDQDASQFISADSLRYLEFVETQSPVTTKTSATQATSSSTPSFTSDVQHLERNQLSVTELVAAYRTHGHLFAKIDPLKCLNVSCPDILTLSHYRLGGVDANKDIQADQTYFGFVEGKAKLHELERLLNQTYCGSVGYEVMHITDEDERQWLLEYIETQRGNPNIPNKSKRTLLQRVVAAESLEKHLDTKFPGTKRFGLEGGESLIPLLETLIQHSAGLGAKEIVMGMPHRGRLNVLINILGKSPKELFGEFEGKKLFGTTGDVKYHQGFSSNLMTSRGELHLAMSFNPSHLEIVSPVVNGSVRARQERRRDSECEQVVPILMHGDAAFAGQGVVMENFQMSQTRAYKTGGSIHVVINNQIGFTISRIEDARSTRYCTEVAKMIQAPIFHVNGDDPEMVQFVSKLAVDYRYKFNKDIVVDLICFRRRGHNETDEPAATQPLMYQAIKNHPGTCNIYAQKLIEQDVLSRDDFNSMRNDYRSSLETHETVVSSYVKESQSINLVDWSPYLGHKANISVDTRVDLQRLKYLGKQISSIPQYITPQRQVAKIYDDRSKMAGGGLEINWGMAELLAYASILDEGKPIRMSGQDCQRGTFSHRHSFVHDQKTGECWFCLSAIDTQADCNIYDSLLSEEAVLGFEYGYSATRPDTLVIWEAQFGDFANGAQVVIDQFIASAEHKWSRLSGLTLLLPHGYEGQGPEHSSARLERYLQLCAEDNIAVCLPTTPSQIFHLLRRQIVSPLRRPLVVMSPKWLLRHKLAVSTLDELSSGSFQKVIDDRVETNGIKRVVLCAGKMYYHLLEKRLENNNAKVALIRIEELYPFPAKELVEILSRYKQVKNVIWCQEEPVNQGAWYNCRHRIQKAIDHGLSNAKLEVFARKPSSAPACGYMATHLEEQNTLLDAAFEI